MKGEGGRINRRDDLPIVITRLVKQPAAKKRGAKYRSRARIVARDCYISFLICTTGTAFTVEWEKVVLQDRPKAGAFTFQVTLHQNGDIVFVYSVIPLLVEKIVDTMHPVKVGLSDAYIMDRTVFCEYLLAYYPICPFVHCVTIAG